MLVNTNASIKNGILKMGKGVVWLNDIKEGLAGKQSSQKTLALPKKEGVWPMPRFLADWHSAQSNPKKYSFIQSWQWQDFESPGSPPPHPPCMFTSSRILWEMWSSCCQGKTGSCRKKRCKELGACSPHMSITAFVSTLQVPHCDLSMQ